MNALIRLTDIFDHNLRFIWLLGIALAVALAAPSLTVHAATINVNSSCSLANAIESANRNRSVGGCKAGSCSDTIVLSGNITLTAALPTVKSTITITGNGFSVSGNYKYRIFEVAGNKRLTINRLILENGRTGDSDSRGGAIKSRGILTVNRSVFRNNRAVNHGGAVYNVGSATIVNSTLHGNSARYGGVIYNWSRLTLRHVTVAGNTTTHNGFAVQIAYCGGNFVFMYNTIIRGNTGNNCTPGFDGSKTRGSYVFDGSCGAYLSSSSGSHRMGSLTNDAYYPLNSGSILIDAADPDYCPAEDQIGATRPFPDGGSCDIGAIERQVSNVQNLMQSEPTPTATLDPNANCVPAGSYYFRFPESNFLGGSIYLYSDSSCRNVHSVAVFAEENGIAYTSEGQSEAASICQNGNNDGLRYSATMSTLNDSVWICQPGDPLPTATNTNVPFARRIIHNLMLTSDEAGRLDVSWDVPEKPPEIYRVNWAHESLDFPGITAGIGSAFPTTNSYSITGLTAGSTYKVRVRGRYELDGVPWSETVKLQVSVNTPVPTATPTHTPEPTNTKEISGRSVRNAGAVATATATATASATATATASETNTSIPVNNRAITGLNLYSNKAGVLVAAWSPPAPQPDDYRIRWAKVGENYLSWQDDSGNAFPARPSYTITGLEPGGRYKVAVRMRRDGNGGPWSEEVEEMVMAAPIPTATNTLPPPTNTALPTNTLPPPTNTAVPTNTLPPPTNTALPTNTLPPPTNTALPTNTLPPPTNTAVPTNTLPPPTNTALPTNTLPPPTNTALPTNTLPPTDTAVPPTNTLVPVGAPTDLTGSADANGITLSWEAPAGPVDGYEILRRLPLQGEQQLQTLVANTGSSATSFTDTSAVIAGERYVYRVKALRGSHKSDQSNYVRIDRES